MNNLEYGIIDNLEIQEGNLFSLHNEHIKFKHFLEKFNFENSCRINFSEYLNLLEFAEKRKSNLKYINPSEIKDKVLKIKSILSFFESEFLNNKYIKSFKDYYLSINDFDFFKLKFSGDFDFFIFNKESDFIKKNIYKLNRANRNYHSLFNLL